MGGACGPVRSQLAEQNPDHRLQILLPLESPQGARKNPLRYSGIEAVPRPGFATQYCLPYHSFSTFRRVTEPSLDL